ncbi:MAG: zinc-ribbon domain-containing protein [Spirochaetaceae bacterium]|jgi:predicted amidophosphoribosyltransferase|nr:zinc-ribbon domain-containing protein [Spirochaetaceae bacterium]
MADYQQQQQQAQQQQAQEDKLSVTLCPNCGSPLKPNAKFCTHCGEKFGGEKHTCIYCKTETTNDICPHCKRRVVPFTCPKCSNKTLNDVCEKCGMILNPQLQAFANEEKKEAPKQMSAEEVRQMEQQFKQAESPEFEAFQKKLIEHQILLEERDYFNNREKRIIKTFGRQPFDIELPDPEEEAFRMKAYAGFEQVIIEKQQKLETDEWLKLFPPEVKQQFDAEIKAVEQVADLAARKKEMEKKYKEMLAKVNDEVTAFRIEEERKRKERERRVLGIYYYGNPVSDYEWIKLDIGNQTSASAAHHCGGHGMSYGSYTMGYDGRNINLTCRLLSYKDCPLKHQNMGNFNGVLNDNGTVISGYWQGAPVTMMKF